MPKDVTCITHSKPSEHRSALTALRNRTTGAVRFAEFLDQDQCRKISRDLSACGKFEAYAHVDGMRKIGFSFSEIRSKDDMKNYTLWRPRLDRELRAICGTNLFDLIHNWLSETWKGGVLSAKVANFPFPPGVVRYQSEGWAGEVAHMDFPPPFVLTESGYVYPMQWGMNLYVSVPTAGGALQIWNERSFTTDEYRAIRENRDPQLDTEKLGTPNVNLEVESGDLVLFPTDYPHAISSIISGDRISFGSFGLLGNESEPIIVWG